MPRALDIFKSALEKKESPYLMYWQVQTLLCENIASSRDPVEAESLLHRAIPDSNLGPAMHSLAMLLLTGDKGVRWNHEEA